MTDRLTGIENSMRQDAPTHNMRQLLNRLDPAGVIPQPNKYYTFIYRAKTPNIQYDQHPFVLVSEVYGWGFTAVNQHWDEFRRYTWNEMSNIFEIYESEVEIVNKLPTAYIRTS